MIAACPFVDCPEDAAVFDATTGDPVACLVHIDDVLERLNAIGLRPDMRETLPALYDPVP